MQHILAQRCTTLLIPVFLSLILGLALPSWALTLEAAKEQGLLGERPNGYLGVVQPGAGAEVRALADEINQKRRQTYADIARRNATSLEAVEILAGKTAIEQTRPGLLIQRPAGEWLKK